MALQLGALRDALIDAGASAERAGKAAEELAGYDSLFDARFGAIDARFGEIDGRLSRMDVRIERLAGAVRAVQILCGANTALALGILWRLLSHTGG